MRRRMLVTRTLVAAALSAGLLAGCPDDGGGAGTADTADAEGDSTADDTGGTTDAGPDTTADAGPDAAPDAGPDTTPDAGPDAGSDGGADAGPDTAEPPALAIDDADEAPITAEVAFEREVSQSVQAGPYVFLLYADKDAGILDVSDPAAPVEHGPITTAGPVLAVVYDEQNHLAYLADATGAVQAVDLSDLEAPAPAGAVTVATLGGGDVRMERIGGELFVAQGTTLLPLAVAHEGGTVQLTPQAPVVLPEPVSVLAAGGGSLFVGGASGTVSEWRRDGGALTKRAEHAVGGSLRGLVAKGSRVLAASAGQGLRVIDFGRDEPAEVFATGEVDDVERIALFGRTVVLTLEREAVVTLDVSDFAKPRVVSTNKGKRPDWVTVSRGTVFFGGQDAGEAASVPPFVSARIPAVTRAAFPRNGVIPVTLSKAVRPEAVTGDTVGLTCGGATVEGDVLLDPSGTTLRFRPREALPAAAECALDLSGVKDAQGQPVTGEGGPLVGFTTAPEGETTVTNPGSAWPHTTDGGFTDWTPGAAEHEWFDITPAKGVYTYFYADFTGEELHILNDWFYNGDSIEPDCYNQFFVYTGGGQEQWDIRAFGDQHVEVRRNGELVDPESEGVQGGAAYGPSPNLEEPHTMYEIRLPASPGAFTVQLHDPGPAFNCAKLEQEPTPMTGELQQGGGGTTTVVQTPAVPEPAAATLTSPENGSTVQAPVTLTWQLAEAIVGTTFSEVQVWNQADEQNLTASALTYATQFTVSAKKLEAGATYRWRVVAWTAAGQQASETWSFTLAGGQPEVVANVDQGSTKQGSSVIIDVLANDVGEGLSLVSVGEAQNGETEIAQSKVRYTPGQGFAGQDSFSYTIRDVSGAQATGQVFVVVEAVTAGSFTLDGTELNTGGTPSNVIVADLDGFATPDIAAGNADGPGIVVFDTGGGGILEYINNFEVTLPGLQGTTTWIAAADLNDDGKRDLVSVDQQGNKLTVFAGTQGGLFAAGQSFPTSDGPTSVSLGDLDGDGFPDIAVGHATGVQVFLNASEGQQAITLQPGTTVEACGQVRQVHVADMNSDGIGDIVVACTTGMTVLAGQLVGELELSSYGVPGIGEVESFAVADITGNGQLDLAVASNNEGGLVQVVTNFTEGGSSAVLLNQPQTTQVGSEVRCITAASLQGSELPDIAVGTSVGTVLVLENHTQPGMQQISLAAPQSYDAGQVITSIASGDLDGDGDFDLVFADATSKLLRVLVNGALSF